MLKDYGSFFIFNEKGKNKNILLTCEHASNDFPSIYDKMELCLDDLNSTITYDKGIKDVSLSLAKKLDCSLILAKYSRILIDLNRSILSRGLIKEQYHNVPIFKNRNLDEAEVLNRICKYYLPYHIALNDKINELHSDYILSMHSFTPKLRFENEPRPWHVCIGFSKDNSLSTCILKNLQNYKEIIVGENKPFNLKDHSKSHGIAHKLGLLNKNSVLFEIRNDLITSLNEQEKWADIIFNNIPSDIKN